MQQPTNPMQKERCCDVCRRSNGVCYGCSCHRLQGQSIKENLEAMNNSNPIQKEEWEEEFDEEFENTMSMFFDRNQKKEKLESFICTQISLAKSQERERIVEMAKKMGKRGAEESWKPNRMSNDEVMAYNQALTDLITALTQKE